MKVQKKKELLMVVREGRRIIPLILTSMIKKCCGMNAETLLNRWINVSSMMATKTEVNLQLIKEKKMKFLVLGRKRRVRGY